MLIIGAKYCYFVDENMSEIVEILTGFLGNKCFSNPDLICLWQQQLWNLSWYNVYTYLCVDKQAAEFQS